MWVFHAVRWNVMFEKLAGLDWTMFILSFFIFSVWFIPCSIRWIKIADLCGYSISFKEAAQGYLIAGFFNSLLPTGTGGDVVRGILSSRHHNYSLGGIFGTIFVERCTGLAVSICFVASIGLAIASRTTILKDDLISIIMIVSLLAILLAAFITPPLQRLAMKLIRLLPLRSLQTGAANIVGTLDACWRNPRIIAWGMGFSLLSQTVSILSGLVMGSAIPGFHAPWYSFFLVIPLSFIVALLPSIGGHGVREAGFVISLGWFGVNKEAAVTFGILRLAFILAFVLVGALFFIANKREDKRNLKM